MKFLSLNLRVLGDASKKLSLKHLISLVYPFIIFIQESMCAKDKYFEYFLSIYPRWNVMATDSCCLLGGMVALWDPKWVNLKAYKFFAGILLSRFIRGFSCHLHFLNLYVSCQDRTYFFENLDACRVLKIGSLQIAGDLNATLLSEVCWGLQSKRDPLITRPHDLFEDNHLVDVQPHPLTPTWSNGRVSENHIIGK